MLKNTSWSELKVNLLLQFYKNNQGKNEDANQILMEEAVGIQLGGIYKGEYKIYGRSNVFAQSIIFAHGWGSVDYMNKSKYKGEFKHSKKHGKGELVFSEDSLLMYFGKRDKSEKRY